ncbi:MAG: YitT family protein [Lachnospiraceae bacterium]
MNAAKIKTLVVDVIFDLIGSFFYSIGIYTFAKMANFAPGGISGIALILNYLWHLPIGLTTLVLNIPLILLSYKIVGKEFLLKSLKTIIISTIFLDVIFPHFPVYTGSQFMAALYSGIFLGIGLALFYMRGSSSGGTDFLTMSIKVLRPHLSIGLITMATDLVVILLGWPVFGTVDAVLYGLTATILTSLVIDKIMYGIDAGRLLIIITDKGEAVAERISALIDRGSTEIRARGSYTKEDKDVLLCACSKSQAYMVRRAAHEVDKNAFVMITETDEVYGEGFLEPKTKQ